MSARHWSRRRSLAVVAVILCLAGASTASSRVFGRSAGAVPRLPASARGQLVSFSLTSRSLGERSARVWVYLPAAYRHDRSRRFPTVYLLQGMPGTGYLAFLRGFHLTGVLDRETFDHHVPPMIMVIPPGSWSFRSAGTEWADGPEPNAHWATFLTHDVVTAVERRFRAIRAPASRGIGGFSAGADAAVNSLMLHPGEFGTAESWSGDFQQTPSLVGFDAELVRRYSPLDNASRAGPALCAHHSHLLLYVGRSDADYPLNIRLLKELRPSGFSPRFETFPGGHSWKLWRQELPSSLAYFGRYLSPGS